MTSIVANGCLLDNQKQFFTFWYINGKNSARQLSNIYGFSPFNGQKMPEKVPKF